jgi:hypothetical protein
MAATLKQTEAAPDDYPDPPDGLSAAAAAIDPAVIWQRIESYVVWRFSVRDVEWVVEGDGCWSPPLTPVTISATSSWQSDAWQTVDDLRPAPMGGYVLPGVGPYRVIGTAGSDDDVPAIVLEAYRRLAEYMAATSFEDVGLRSENVPNIWQGEYGSPSWRAKALQDSGAADLLRNYRRA